MRNPFLFVGLGLALVACGSVGKTSAEKFCELNAECYPEDNLDVEACVANSEIAEDDECKAELTALQTCLGNISDCDTLDDYWEEPTEDYPCSTQENAFYDCFFAE